MEFVPERRAELVAGHEQLSQDEGILERLRGDIRAPVACVEPFLLLDGRDRLRAASIHLGLSALVAALALGAAYWMWRDSIDGYAVAGTSFGAHSV